MLNLKQDKDFYNECYTDYLKAKLFIDNYKTFDEFKNSNAIITNVEDNFIDFNFGRLCCTVWRTLEKKHGKMVKSDLIMLDNTCEIYNENECFIGTYMFTNADNFIE
jgi:hypothetical protein